MVEGRSKVQRQEAWAVEPDHLGCSPNPTLSSWRNLDVLLNLCVDRFLFGKTGIRTVLTSWDPYED